jgi:uncharacterized protein
VTKNRFFVSFAVVLLVAVAAVAGPKRQLKILFHVDSPRPERLEMAFHNAHSAEMHAGKGNIKMVVVANGPAVKFFLKEDAGKFSGEINDLVSTGDVEFHVCGTSLKALGYEAQDVLGTCKVVPAGVIDIADLENEGFVYIKP